MKRLFYIILVATATVACSEGPSISATEARRVSDATIAKDYNIQDLTALRVTVRDNEDNWIFAYDVIDENSLGGPFSVTVDKKSGRVVDQGGYQ